MLHWFWLATAAKVPGKHAAHIVPPGEALVLPGAQSVQAALMGRADTAPTEGEGGVCAFASRGRSTPAGHRPHVTLPVRVPKPPGMQSSHITSPDRSLNAPGGHYSRAQFYSAMHIVQSAETMFK